MLTWHEDIRPNSGKKASDGRKQCWDGTGIGNNVGFWECHTQGGNQLFKFIPEKKQIYHVPSRGCATADKNNKKVVLKYCDDKNPNQRWWWDETTEEALKLHNGNMAAIVAPPELDYLS
jgi:polypeptide N-acetylgalactosaminyltransferase